MDYPVTTPGQLRTVLRALRHTQHLSQTQAGLQLGVSQKRLARIEANPGVTGFYQIARLVSALGARLVITMPPARRSSEPTKAKGAANANTW